MKAYFLSRLFREKILLVLLVGAGAVVWLSSVSGRLSAWYADHRRTTFELNEQAVWLSQRERIEEEAMSAIRNLDPARSFNGVRLSAELSNLAAAAGLGGNTTSEVLPPERTAQFAVNAVRLRITRATWESLKTFYLELSKRAPYITIDQFAVVAERNNPSQLTANLRVVAVEVTPGQ
jgi:hypothetical protein